MNSTRTLLRRGAAQLSPFVRRALVVQTVVNVINRYLALVVNTRLQIMSWFKWRPTSQHSLELAEQKLMSYIKSPYQGYFVDIGEDWGQKHNRIWTVEIDRRSDNRPTVDDDSLVIGHKRRAEPLPIVLVHGFGAGVGMWSLNYDEISQDRKIYAFDVIGFGRSSRPNFDWSSPENVEYGVVSSFERWRMAMGLERFILLGHSFGGYLAASYALQYPDHISHLILADPWGMPSAQLSQQDANPNRIQVPAWVRLVASVLFHHFTPLAPIRAAGPFGPRLIHKFRPDLKHKFEELMGPEDADLVLDYIYHCNAQDKPSGERTMKALSGPMGWAKFPMIQRVTHLDPSIELTFIYGSRSWIDRQPAIQIRSLLRDRSVDIHVVQGAGHHVYADKYQDFNDLVRTTCAAVDERLSELSPAGSETPSENLHEND